MSIVLQGPVFVLCVRKILSQKKIKANFSPNITAVATVIAYDKHICKKGDQLEVYSISLFCCLNIWMNVEGIRFYWWHLSLMSYHRFGLCGLRTQRFKISCDGSSSVLHLLNLVFHHLKVLLSCIEGVASKKEQFPLLTISSLVCVVSLSFAVIPGSALSRSSALKLFWGTGLCGYWVTSVVTRGHVDLVFHGFLIITCSAIIWVKAYSCVTAALTSP